MQAGLVRKFKLFFAWQDEQEENWLRQMAQQGLHLVSPGVGVYTFQKGEPRDVAYRLDYISSRSVEQEDYLQLFRDAGWEYAGSLFNWQYFRKPVVSGEADEIYTDPESKVRKYQRLIGVLVAFLPVYIALLISGDEEPAQLERIYSAAHLLGFLLLILYAVAILKIAARIRQLKRL